MKKLKINRACPATDLASISAFPPMVDNSRNVNVLRQRLDGRNAPPAQVFNNRHIPPLRNSYLASSSQSQQSFSQGLTQLSQNTQFSQNSQEEIITNDQWRYGSQERDNSTRRNPCLAPYSYGSNRDESSQVLHLTRPSTANSMLQRINPGSNSDDKCRVSEELEQRLGSVDKALNRVIIVLDAVQSDLQQVNKAVKDVSLETEGIRQKIVVQENTLQLLLKEEEEVKGSLLGSLKTIPDRISQETSKLKLDELSDALRTIPKMMTERLSAMKSELCCSFAQELKAISESLKARERHQQEPDYQIALQPHKTLINSILPTNSQAKRPNKERHEPSAKEPSSVVPKKPRTEKIQQIPRIMIETEGLVDKRINYNLKAGDSNRPSSFTYARRKTMNNSVVKQEKPSYDQENSKMSGIIINIEDDEEFLYFLGKADPWRNVSKVHQIEDPHGGPKRQEEYGDEEEDQEAQRILRNARRRRRVKGSYKFNYGTGTSSSSS